VESIEAELARAISTKTGIDLKYLAGGGFLNSKCGAKTAAVFTQALLCARKMPHDAQHPAYATYFPPALACCIFHRRVA
jgi:hypothetical protein